MRTRSTNEIVDAFWDQFASLRNSIVPTKANVTSFLRDDLMTTARREGRQVIDKQVMPTLEDVRHMMSLRDPQLVAALDRIAEAQERLADQIEADRRERASLRDVLLLLAERLPPADSAAAPTPTVIGGSVRAFPTLVLTEAEREDTDHNGDNGKDELRLAVEVRGRFGDRWAEGFEVADIVDDERGRRYLLRRLSDGHVIPTYFEERDVRPVTRNLR